MTIHEALLRVGEELKIAMTAQLKSNGSNNTGNLANSIEYKVEQRDYEYNLIRTMLKYGDYVDQGIGRGPGKRPPVEDIMDWLEMKRIPLPTGMVKESFAFLIARKIGKEGTNPKPRPFITPSITSVLNNTGKKILSQAGIDEVLANINGSLQSIKITA